MALPLNREQALELLRAHNKDQHDFYHYLESEAVMGALAERLGEDRGYWGMLGLLHDVDWGETKNDTPLHLTLAPSILREAGFDDEFVRIIVSHGYGFDCAGLKDKKRESRVEHALACAETVTGLIHSYGLMRKGLAGMEVSGLKKKFKDKKFAAAIDRDIIMECEKIGLGLDEFLGIAIKAICGIAGDVGFGSL